MMYLTHECENIYTKFNEVKKIRLINLLVQLIVTVVALMFPPGYRLASECSCLFVLSDSILGLNNSIIKSLSQKRKTKTAKHATLPYR